MRTSTQIVRSAKLALLAAGSIVGIAACASAPAAPPAPSAMLADGPFAPDSVHSRVLSRGVRYSALRLPGGPWWVHLVEVSPQTCGVEFRAVKATDRVVGRERASSMARRTARALERPVLAAVNADFFSFTPPGVPEGPHIGAGAVLTGSDAPRPVFGVTRGGQAFLADAELEGGLRAPDGFVIPIERVNSFRSVEGLALYTSDFGGALPDDTVDVTAVRVRRFGSVAIVGDTVRGVVAEITTSPDTIANDPNVVFIGRGPAATLLRGSVERGDTLAWVLRASGVPGTPRELIGGGPMLLRSGEPVFEDDPRRRGNFVTTRHPRTAVALRPDGGVVLLVVDGRNPGHSVGMNLEELTRLLHALGAVEALNLDGGGSTVLVLGESVTNRPSDQAGERSIANALLLLGPEPGSCGTQPDGDN